MARLGEVPFARYYGSVDGTPLFVMLAGLYLSRTGDLETIPQLWPSIEAALRWIDRYGDRDGDGFVEYFRADESGLANQGWKDSSDSIYHADGSLARGPIALCEVQGYVFAAKCAAARIAAALGHAARARRLTREAEALSKRFDEAFWCEEIGTYAIALDGDKRRCVVRSSNAGQLLFTGIAPKSRGMKLGEQLLKKPFFSGWGVRTIAAGEMRYNPMSYHNGSIWPHDNALIGLGLERYGLKHGLAGDIHRALRRGLLHGFAAPAGALLRLPAHARQRSHSLSRGLHATSLVFLRSLRIAASEPRPRVRTPTHSACGCVSPSCRRSWTRSSFARSPLATPGSIFVSAAMAPRARLACCAPRRPATGAWK